MNIVICVRAAVISHLHRYILTDSALNHKQSESSSARFHLLSRDIFNALLCFSNFSLRGFYKNTLWLWPLTSLPLVLYSVGAAAEHSRLGLKSILNQKIKELSWDWFWQDLRLNLQLEDLTCVYLKTALVAASFHGLQRMIHNDLGDPKAFQTDQRNLSILRVTRE